MTLRGQTWRRVPVEFSGDEAGIAGTPQVLPAPSLGHFGLPTPDRLVGIALKYQIAQKLHAATDPHDPPAHVNDRARDIVDLLLLRELPGPPLHELRGACRELFAARAKEATATGADPRAWPPTVVAFAHWRRDYSRAARDAGLDTDLDEAIATLNAWILDIEATTT